MGLGGEGVRKVVQEAVKAGGADIYPRVRGLGGLVRRPPSTIRGSPDLYRGDKVDSAREVDHLGAAKR